MSSVLQFKATLDQILGSINELKRGSISAQYGTVLGVSPLQVSLDDDPATPLNGVPVSLVSGLVVGDRVWTVSFRLRTIVVGRVGGQRPSIIPMSGPLWGSVGAQPVVLSGSAVTTTNTTGDARVEFPTSLAGISSVTVVSGDSGAQSGEITLRNSPGDYSATSFVVHTPTANRTTRINWILVGWTD